MRRPRRTVVNITADDRETAGRAGQGKRRDVGKRRNAEGGVPYENGENPVGADGNPPVDNILI